MTHIELLQSSPTLFLIVLAIVGLLVGSFLNVVIHRLPIMLNRQWRQESTLFLHPDQEPEPLPSYNLIVPASSCPQCDHRIRPWENIPVLSYLFLKGRCAACHTKIPCRYPAIEMASAALVVLIGSVFGVSEQTLVLCVLGWSLLALTMIDWDTQLLPDDITLPLLWLGLLVNYFGLIVPVKEALLGAFAGYLSLWSVYWVFKLVTGKEGMGYGDFKLLAALGAWLGWGVLPLIILLSSLVGTLFALVLILLKRQERSNPIPFGPFLSVAGVIAMLWGDSLIQYYFQMSGIQF